MTLTAVGQDVLKRAQVLLDFYDDLSNMSTLFGFEAVGKVRLGAPDWHGEVSWAV